MTSTNTLFPTFKKIVLGACGLIVGVCGIAFSLSSFAAFNTAPPASGALTTGTYRNLASEMGKTDAVSKLNASWDAMFVNSSKIYYTYSTDKAYIEAPDSYGGPDIRTEGQSWGMTIAVMMNKQTEFDKLWRFAAAYQRNANGTFKWQMRNVSGTITTVDAASAPDGELYFAFALLNADARWGSGGGINYYNEGVAVLTAIKNNLMLSNLLRFSTGVANAIDPSYQIPAFYNYFANRLTVQADKDYWNARATDARTFLSAHFTAVASSNGNLPTFLAGTNGSPLSGNLFVGQANPAEYYEFDAWRVALNVGIDAHMSGAQTWHKNAVNGVLYKLKYEHTTYGCYKQKFSGGAGLGTDCESYGQKAANASALLSSTNSADATFFFDRFWAQSFPTDLYRYYNGSLHMLAMLHTTGEFKFYMPAAGGANKLLNSGFATNTTSWNYNQGGTGAGSLTWFSPGNARVNITSAGANTYDVQLSQNTTITAGKSYKVEFDAAIAEGTSRTIQAAIEKTVSPYTSYGASPLLTLTTTWQHFTHTFTAVSATDSGVRLVFQLGANANDVLWDNITLVEL
jgi:oligosaccharide reducing-end xylanase